MRRHYRKTFLGLGTLALAGAFTASATPTLASSLPVTHARIAAHFDFTAGQQPENITLEPNGDADVTFAFAHQVAALGTVWKVWPRTGTAEVWASGQNLQPAAPGGFGVNGLKVHDGSVWVSNSSQGTLLSIPLLRDGTAGAAVVAATGLASIDDFSFTGPGDTLLAALSCVPESSAGRPHRRCR